MRVVACEGPLDRAFVEALRAKGLITYPLDAQPKRGAPPPHGLDRQAQLVGDEVNAGKSPIVLRDLDELTAEQAVGDVLRRVRKARSRITFEQPTLVGNVAHVKATGDGPSVDVCVVLVGLPGDPSSLGIKTATIDDYVLRLLLTESVFTECIKEERTVRTDHALLSKKLREARTMLEANGIPAESSDQFVALACGIVHFRPSRADLVDRLIGRATGVAVLEAALHPLLDDLRAAAS